MILPRRRWFPVLALLCSACAAGSPALAQWGSLHRNDTGPASPRPAAIVVVTTTMLGTAVSELTGDWCTVKVLLPPQGCPGEFDLSPVMLRDLRSAGLILRHDYQGSLDDRLRGAENPAARKGVISSGGAETLPENYLALCRQVADILRRTYPQHAFYLNGKLSALEKRVREVALSERTRAAAVLQGAPLLTAGYQTEFVNWAGGKAVVTFERGEDLSLKQIQEIAARAGEAKVAGVVGNLQWGDREMHALSEALHVPGTLLSNYPVSSEPGSWDRLLAANMHSLLTLFGHE